MADQPKMRVKALYIYPIKSLRGFPLPSVTATYRGFAHDRRFALYPVAAEKHMSVAKNTEMCLFTQHTTDHEAEFEVRYSKDHAFDKPDQKVSDEVLRVEYEPSLERLVERQVTMHSSPTVGYDMGEKYNKWFSERFGYEVRLIYIGGNSRRVLGNMSPNVAERLRRKGLKITAEEGPDGGSGWLGGLTSTVRGVVGNVVGGENKENESDGIDEGIPFSDIAPYLVVTTKSWENVNRRLPEGEEMDIEKFRPNVVVEGAGEEYEEDFWAELQVGEGTLVLTNNCARCNSLNVDYSTGKVGAGESGKILKKMQSDRRIDSGMKYSPVFGRYGFLAKTKLAEETGSVELKVGDSVAVLKKNHERTVFEWPNISTTPGNNK